eukprot:TRINITY_DN5342_c0_g1_i7.p1 TRINITY_DN5342_c0_g1~~TRINITY_DN5342_c0_g1_i7.p1  ORF type:complete len:836 (-),score=161.80 TRINITY_DN5342_c0_g1_i7:45-2552(-)
MLHCKVQALSLKKLAISDHNESTVPACSYFQGGSTVYSQSYSLIASRKVFEGLGDLETFLFHHSVVKLRWKGDQRDTLQVLLSNGVLVTIILNKDFLSSVSRIFVDEPLIPGVTNPINLHDIYTNPSFSLLGLEQQSTQIPLLAIISSKKPSIPLSNVKKHQELSVNTYDDVQYKITSVCAGFNGEVVMVVYAQKQIVGYSVVQDKNGKVLVLQNRYFIGNQNGKIYHISYIGLEGGGGFRKRTASGGDENIQTKTESQVPSASSIENRKLSRTVSSPSLSVHSILTQSNSLQSGGSASVFRIYEDCSDNSGGIDMVTLIYTKKKISVVERKKIVVVDRFKDKLKGATVTSISPSPNNSTVLIGYSNGKILCYKEKPNSGITQSLSVSRVSLANNFLSRSNSGNLILNYSSGSPLQSSQLNKSNLRQSGSGNVNILTHSSSNSNSSSVATDEEVYVLKLSKFLSEKTRGAVKIMSWHHSSSLVLLSFWSGEVILLDRAMTPVCLTLVGKSGGSYTSRFGLALNKLLGYGSDVMSVEWASDPESTSLSFSPSPNVTSKETSTLLSTTETSSISNSEGYYMSYDTIALVMDRGPIILLHLSLSTLCKGDLSNLEIFNNRLSLSQMEESLKLLFCLDDESEFWICFSKIVNFLLRVDLDNFSSLLSPDEYLLIIFDKAWRLFCSKFQRYLFHATNLYTRFFLSLLRKEKIEEAYRVAVDIGTIEPLKEVIRVCKIMGENFIGKQAEEKLAILLPPRYLLRDDENNKSLSNSGSGDDDKGTIYNFEELLKKENTGELVLNSQKAVDLGFWLEGVEGLTMQKRFKKKKKEKVNCEGWMLF